MPLFQIRFDMSWANWVLTANCRKGLPEPLQSRCVVLDLPDLTRTQLRDFAVTEGERRGLPEPSLSALDAIFEHEVWAEHTLSLRTVSRVLDRAEALVARPHLHRTAMAVAAAAGDLSRRDHGRLPGPTCHQGLDGIL